jgi:Ni2+-binding GTPase involved in maturation of urease and hydrogenase
MVERALESLPIEALDFLFVENVGNCVAPSIFVSGRTFGLSCCQPSRARINH